MKRKIISCIIAGLTFVASCYAQRVSISQVQNVALNFLTIQNRDNDLDSSKQILNVIPLGKSDTTMYAVSSSHNWVLISGDMRVTPILAYSDENKGPFPSVYDMPPAVEDLLEWYDAQIVYVRDSCAERNPHPEWSNFLNGRGLLTRSDVVSPLLYRHGLENLWGQSGTNSGGDSTKYYNKFCPSLHTLNQDCEWTMVGCVAVATSQVMWYWQWPFSAIIHDDGGNSFVREYDWNLMTTQITNATALAEANMTAKLLHDVGVAVHMNYGCSSSSAFPTMIPPALINNYNYYADGINYRSHYTDSIWLQMIRANLNELKPILYGGSNTSGGAHRFVIDGYNSANEFHANLGWKGYCNGYYLLDSIGISSKPFKLGQSAIMNIRPNYPSCDDWTELPLDTIPQFFVLQTGGSITLGNRIIPSGKKGAIYSGRYIELTSGFEVKEGAEVYFDVKDMHCEEIE